jgi:hypothetical protein
MRRAIHIEGMQARSDAATYRFETALKMTLETLSTHA